MGINGRPKTVLVYPPTGSISTYNTPTGLLYIGSYLKKHGYPVKLVDCWAEPKYRDILEREVIYPKKLIWKKMKQNPINGVAILCFVLVSKLRLKFLFYRFPIEFRLLDWYYKYILKKVPDFA